MKQQLLKHLQQLDLLGAWLALLSLRLLLAWDFYESGIEKLHGENWFGEIQSAFPFPFNQLPPEISWQMATWFEILGGVALLIGLATRFFSVSLIVLTVVAIASVHWPAEWHSLGQLLHGYVLTDRGQGNFKLPLIFIGMLLPLALLGPGRLSIDHLLRHKCLT